MARSASSESRLALRESLKARLKTVNARLAPHEKLGCLAVVTTPWTPENGFVTPTLRVKRPRIEEVYAERYEGWFSQGEPAVRAEA